MSVDRIVTPSGQTITAMGDGTAMDAMSHMVRSFSDYFSSWSRVKSNPVPAAATAAGVGILLGGFRSWMLPLLLGAGVGILMRSHDAPQRIAKAARELAH
jgi:hypothetical protein